MFWFWVTLTLLAILCIFLIYAAVRLRKKGERQTAGSVIGSLLLYVLLTLIVLLLLRLDIPPYLLWLGMLVVWFNGYVGHYLDKYNTSTHFDRYLHVFGSFTFALIAYCILRSFIPEGGSRLFRAVFVWTLGGFLGAAFEVYEFRHDRKKGTHTQHGLQDTDTDLAADLIGGLLAAVFAFCFLIPV